MHEHSNGMTDGKQALAVAHGNAFGHCLRHGNEACHDAAQPMWMLLSMASATKC